MDSFGADGFASFGTASLGTDSLGIVSLGIETSVVATLRTEAMLSFERSRFGFGAGLGFRARTRFGFLVGFGCLAGFGFGSAFAAGFGLAGVPVRRLGFGLGARSGGASTTGAASARRSSISSTWRAVNAAAQPAQWKRRTARAGTAPGRRTRVSAPQAS